jgi:threonine aldolase
MTTPIIDLRSDTLTKPTPAMRKAMAEAEVGDDVFGEDPTVNRLQDTVAKLLGKEAALFVSSGTMGNQLAIKCHTAPGDEVLCEGDSHPFNYEAAGPAFLSGVQMRPLAGKLGVISKDQLAQCLRPNDHHYPQSRLVLLENTHNRAGGAIFPIEEMTNIFAFTQSNGLRLHLDGARLWNAHVATEIPLHEYGQCCDSVTVCLSKGLGAPVGSVLAGTREFIDKAHRYRKMWGGGMRQAGILAAAGLYAIEHHVQRLSGDHDHAQRLARALNSLPGIQVDMAATQTNIVMADLAQSGKSAFAVMEELGKKGLLTIAMSPTRLRLVTHLDISSEQVEQAILILKSTLESKKI